MTHPQKRHDGKALLIVGAPGTLDEGEKFVGIYHHQPRKRTFEFDPRNGHESLVLLRDEWFVCSTDELEIADHIAANQRQRAKKYDAPHLMIIARAGTGKTTTLIEGLKIMQGLPTQFTPSEQQAEIWEQMKLSKDAKTVCMVAFNKSIATELQERIPNGYDAMTMHSMGFRAVRETFGSVKVNSYRVQDIIAELLERDIRELRKYKPTLVQATEKLVGLCKQTLTNVYLREKESLDQLCQHYDIDLNGDREEVFNLVPRVIERCKQVDKDGCIDFNDMIWLPIALDLPLFTYDVLLVDEAQDLNRCQQELALRAGKRLIFCGDPKQAIYGFAGADCKAMEMLANNRLDKSARGCMTLPLNVTRRCAKSIVDEARHLITDFEAFAENPQGTVGKATMDRYTIDVEDGNMILCRVNAPLVSQCFRFLKEGRKATIQGRDIGQGLVSTIKKMKCDDLGEFTYKLGNWLQKEVEKENKKRNPSEARIIALHDRYDCLQMFADESETVAGMIKKIEDIFSDNNRSGIKLSSIHKAKGLEASRVFFLEPEGASCPHPMARSAWQVEQEYNLRYVAITRAIVELVYVGDK